MVSNDIKIRNLSFCRDKKCIYDDVNCDIPANKITAILGRSGEGKTTLLELISGLLKPKSGRISILDEEIDAYSKENYLSRIRSKMGFLFQSGALFTQMNVFDNIAFPLRQNTNLDESIIRNIVLMKLEAVGLVRCYNMMPSELSGGMSRRIALARSIALDPSIMLYDEPFTGQDPISFNALLKLIRTLNKSLNMTSLIVSHDIEESLSIADHVIIINNKKVALSDSVDNIKNIQNDFIQSFLSGTEEKHVEDLDNKIFTKEIFCYKKDIYNEG